MSREALRRAGVQTGFLADAGLAMSRGRGWAGLAGDALAFVLCQLAPGERWLVVVDGPDRAERLLRALRFLHPDPRELASFPADDTRPYDGFSPDPEIPRTRLRTLQKVAAGGPVLVVAPVQALVQRVPDSDTRQRGTRVLRPEQQLDRDALMSWLTDAGYLASQRVESAGFFAARGDVVDVWPAGRAAPVRIDFFDDEIEDIRRLDAGANRPGRTEEAVVVLPNREERIDGLALERAHRELARLVAAQGGRGIQLRRRVVEELKAGIRFSAIEDWLPALVTTSAPLDELAGLRTVVVHPEEVAAAARDLVSTARRRWEVLDDDERPLVPPGERYVDAQVLLDALAEAQPVFPLAAGREAIDLGAVPAQGFAVRGTELAPVVARLHRMASDDDVRVGLVVDSERRATGLLELLEPHGLDPKMVGRVDEMERGKVSLLIGDLPSGFVAEESGWALIPVSALFGGGAQRSRKAERLANLFEGSVTSMAQLKEGDPVVHRLHGIGRYQGLHRIAVQKGIEQDFVKLEYRGGDLLFLPVTALDQLSRFTAASSGVQVKLDKLGGATWAARRGKVRDSLLHMAQGLLELYARRELAVREPNDPPGPMYRAFEARFPYEETPDQAAAIEAVQEDLGQPYPMDRLLCGDVGFGKTEVALRAAMRVVESGRQVAILCPTTVLAYQHLHTFRDRFAGFPVEVAMLSRFNSAAEDRRVKKGLREGSIDIVVGTTAVLARSVHHARLGLVVIDEEHRFGVKQKDRLRRLRTEVDVLAMSATPIPRTLQMALSGVRQMSIMATPPAERLMVRTTIARMTEARVRDAITRERERGGQVFVIHNRIETIERFADRLREWVPDANIAVAHGQMDEGTLEQILVDFVQGRSDVLVCTSIVESGIDIPNVNTMLVHRADRFGLAQLYQLRGRVGRANVRASCILLVPEDLSRDAQKRLRVLVEHTQLGAGFQIAAADLELRGGGHLLGAQQSGNIDKVGYEAWLEILNEAVGSARGDLDRQRIDPEVEVPVQAFLPDVLITDPHERLEWYRRFSNATTAAGVDRLVEELEGWVGDLPPEVENLAGLTHTRIACRHHGIVRCAWLKVRVVLELHESSPLTEEVLGRVVARHPKRFGLKGGSGAPRLVSVRFTPREGERPFRYLRWVFAQLARGREGEL